MIALLPTSVKKDLSVDPDLLKLHRRESPNVPKTSVEPASVTETGAQSQKLLGSYAFFVAKRQLRKTTSASNSASPISEMAFFSNKLIRRSSPLTGTTSE